MVIFCYGSSPASAAAVGALRNLGWRSIDHPAPEITHLLLPIPSFRPDGMLPDGKPMESVLERLPEDICIIGGKLSHPALSSCRTIDLLGDPVFAARNAGITAHCGLRILLSELDRTLCDSPALIIGWGRIGKCLGRMLRGLDCPTVIAVRKEADLGLLAGLGYQGILMHQIESIVPSRRIIVNTVPAMVMPEAIVRKTRDAVLLDLASLPGIAGGNVIWARELPGRYAPESTGLLIAQRIYELVGCK